MKTLSKCCQAKVRIIDGEYICPKCWQPCEVEPECALEREDAEYENARMMGWED